jgi:hypothetical protein
MTFHSILKVVFQAAIAPVPLGFFIAARYRFGVFRTLQQVTSELVRGREVATGGEADEGQRANRSDGGLHEHDHHLIADCHKRGRPRQDLACHHLGKLHEPHYYHAVHPVVYL